MQTLSCIGVIGAPIARGETRFIPSLGFSERYDSNIFASPSGLTPPGKKPWDMATSVTPGIQIVDKDRVVETNLSANVNGTAFMNNPELNFVATQLTGVIKLDGLVGQLIPGLKLQVSDSFRFSPEAPSFVTAGTPAPTENVFARGIQPVRANTFTNTASVTASYPLSKSLGVKGAYAYSLFRVGKILVEQSPDVPVVFFNTDFQRLSVGPTYNLARGDNLGVNYNMVTATFTDKTANVSGVNVNETITAHGVEAHYSTGGLHWGAYASGGATIVEREGTAFFSGKVTLSGAIDPSTGLSVDVSRQLAPTFFGTAGVMISTAAGVTVERRLADSLSLSGSANYAINEGTGANVIRFESYGGSMLLNYNFSQSTIASLSYRYFHSEVSSPGFETMVNRSMAMLSLTSNWK